MTDQERTKGSQDALDRPRARQRFNKKQKQEYAKKMFVEELLIPPKNPIPPLVLPKAPPGRIVKT